MSALALTRRVGRTIAFLLMAYPHSLITVPLAGGAAILLAESLLRPQWLAGLDQVGSIGGLAWIAGLLLFVVLSLLYLAIVLREGWGDDGRAAVDRRD